MEISAILTDANGALLTGKAASTALKVRRVADGFLLDWDDLTFKAAAWGTLATPLLEVDAANLPGYYKKAVVTASWNDGFYQAFLHFDDGTTVLNFASEKCIQGGQEVEMNLDAAVSSLTSQGTGAIAWTYTLTRADNGQPIADADVWVTTDEAGSNVIASGRTNQSGIVTFYLDAGSVYVWRQKSGFDFDNPDLEEVSA